MQERISFEGIEREIKRSGGKLSPSVAWEIAELVDNSGRPNTPISDVLKISGYVKKTGVEDLDLLDRLIEVRQEALSNLPRGANRRLVGVDRMIDLFLELGL